METNTAPTTATYEQTLAAARAADRRWTARANTRTAVEYLAARDDLELLAVFPILDRTYVVAAVAVIRNGEPFAGYIFHGDGESSFRAILDLETGAPVLFDGDAVRTAANAAGY